MITFFAKAGMIATAVASGIAIIGLTIAGIALAVSKLKNRGNDNETVN